jgi:hypothetical protein
VSDAPPCKTKNRKKFLKPFGNHARNVLIALLALLISSVMGAAESATFEVFEHRGAYTLDAPPPEMHPVVLSVPRDFLYGSGLPKRNFGINILTYYPSFSSPNDPNNASFGLACAGICNGRILISIENRAHSVSTSSPNMADYIARAELRWSKTPPYPPNVHVRDLNSKIGGFDEAFEETISTLTDRKIVQTHRVYFRKDADGQHYNLTAVCNVTDRATGCVLHFSLTCNSEIYVSVHGIDGSYLDRAADIKEKTDHFISTMVQKPFCSN